ncbi:hypothetical protein [Micromonospora echinofusca]|uniref:TraR/DksA family transcriptional regulator n=1 Tax=Micromonospora echinofusca TaxID=47858 RepID=A0ABS3VU20_MICEH|nr:hypothetical protein [Micromonospora echinofusca]MBO4207858.1 TraR/DksA family transcriptional regulator [Micromonospora echinofusca]
MRTHPVSRQDELDVLRMVLEEQYERHRTQLALLARQADRSGRTTVGAESSATVTAVSRRALGDLSRALHHLEQGRYGRCQRCRTDIAIEYLAHRPVARYCPRCEVAPPPGSDRHRTAGTP